MSADKFKSFCTALCVLCSVLFTNVAWAKYIQDNAKLLSEEQLKKFEDILAKIETNSEFHLEVVILPNFYGKPKDAVLKAYYDQLEKNAPKIYRRAILLIAMEPGVIYFNCSANLDPIFTAKFQDKLYSIVKSKVREGNYDAMVGFGIAEIYKAFLKVHPDQKQQGGLSQNALFNALLFIFIIGVIIFLVNKKVK